MFIEERVQAIKELKQEIQSKIIDKKLLSEENAEMSSKLQSFYENLMKNVPSIDPDMDDIVFGMEIAGGLSRCDIYVPLFDLVIEFDGPCHFI